MPRILQHLLILVVGAALGAVGGARAQQPTILDDFQLGHHTSTDADDATDSTASAEKKKEDAWDVTESHGPSIDIAFETSEGTWMSADVSPDGSTLLFDILGDIYTLPIGGGQATRVLGDRSWDYQPRWSPDGNEILFTSDRGGTDNLWIAKADGAGPKAFTKEKDRVSNCGAWSPDGEAIVAKRRLTDASSIGTTELWLYDRRGGDGIQISKKDDLPEVSEPVFHPDGRFVYFSARPSRFGYDRNVHQGIYEIRRYDRKTGDFSTVAQRSGGASRPAFSPDGRWLSFISRDGIETVLWLRDLQGGAERALWRGLDRDLQESFAWAGTYPSMDWTPDGKSIACYAGGKIWLVDVNSGVASEVAFKASVDKTAEEALRFKPDVTGDTMRLRMLRWIRQNPKSGDLYFSALGRIYQAEADGSNPRIWLRKDDDEHFEYAPSFDPGGENVAYVGWNDEAKGHVWRARANGSGARRLTDIPGQYANPNWSPDGKLIVYLRGSGATLRGGDMGDELWHEIYVIDSGGGEPEYVATVANRGAQSRMPNPRFGPKGERVYYMENGGGENTVQYVSLRLDGTDKKTHATVKYGEEIEISPDGKWIAYKQLHDAYVAPLPLAGTAPLELGDSDGAVRVKKLSDGLADWIHWTDASTVTWAAGPTMFVQSMEKAWAESEEKSDESDEDEDEEDDAPDPNAPDSIELVMEQPRHRPSGTLILSGARLITMNGDEIIDDGVIVIDGNRIVAIGRRGGDVEIPAGGHVVDARGMTAIPGLVDAHAHLGYGGLDINPQRDWRYFANLAYGVTTTMDPSASTQLVFAQSEMVEAGVMKGPRIYSTGFILYGADIPGKAPTNSLDDARKHVKRLKTLGAFAVKSYMQPRREQRQWYIKAAREAEMLVFPEGGGNFEANMGMILDGHTGIEHTAPPANLYDDVVQFWSATEVGYTPTLLVSYGGLSGENYFYQHEEPVWQNQKLLRFTPRADLIARSRRLGVFAYDDDWNHMLVAASAKKLIEKGVMVNMGAHGQRQGLGCHWELWAIAQGGASNHDVLRCGTISPARYIGLGDEIGSLEEGKLADIVLLGADPLTDIRNTDTVRFVVKNGELFDADTMDQIWPVSSTRGAFVWE
jgi:Tol biopolymer transport system component/imidazolonepropionase-like amidohydrolase